MMLRDAKRRERLGTVGFEDCVRARALGRALLLGFGITASPVCTSETPLLLGFAGKGVALDAAGGAVPFGERSLPAMNGPDLCLCL